MKRLLGALCLGLLTISCAQAQQKVKRILLIPVDSRPAVTQFPEMIGDLAGVEVVTPPSHLLGEFLQPGNPSGILNWLKSTGIEQYDAVVASADMIAYGGLIASRVDRSSYNLAMIRLRDFWKIRKTDHHVPFYVFTAQMRIAPTATDESVAYRRDLYYWAVTDAKYRLNGDPTTKYSRDQYAKSLPEGVLDRYVQTRQRNVEIQLELLKMTYHGAFTHLTIGQDDTAPIGPHSFEGKTLADRAAELKISDRVQFCSGIDQIANLLVSRSILNAYNFSPDIDLRYADTDGANKVAAYESKTIGESLYDQITTSGGNVKHAPELSDYTIFVNTPDSSPRAYDDFIQDLQAKADSGAPIAVADVDLGWTGTATSELYLAITTEKRAPKLLSYAGWNTAGNSMGTTIPAANLYFLGRQAKLPTLHREVALRKFLLHRLVNDYYYHRHVRPEAYELIEKLNNGKRDEVYGDALMQATALVRKDMRKYLDDVFDNQFLGRAFEADGKTYRITSLENVEISLPWPRAFEVYINFDLTAKEVEGRANQ
ncbi:MAG: DUF4127 family protein [Armatimonadetes bacterium]|nr:DUF4127 family protein [Armatimonadota bacterium]